MQRYVTREEVREFAAAVGAGEAEQQDCRILAFEDFVGSTATPLLGRSHENPDVIDEQRVLRCAGYLRRIPDKVAATSSCADGDRCPVVRCWWAVAAIQVPSAATALARSPVSFLVSAASTKYARR